MSVNELAVSPDELAQAAAEVSAPISTPELDLQPDMDLTEPDADVDVPESDFWDEIPGYEKTSSKEDADEPEAIVDDTPPTGTITFKANGKEQSVSVEEAQKLLSHVAGARKAFTDKAKVQKQYDKIKQEAAELHKYKKSWDDLEAVKNNPAELYQLITGKSLDSYLTQELERRKVYADATPEERGLLDYESRVQTMEQELQRERQRRESEMQKVEKIQYDTELNNLQGKLEREYYKYELPGEDPQVTNKLGKMFWRSAIADLKEYDERGIPISDKAIAKAFKDNIAVIKALYTKEVAKGVDQKSKVKKQVAKEKAQIASTRNYTAPATAELSSKNPLDIFYQMTGRKR